MTQRNRPPRRVEPENRVETRFGLKARLRAISSWRKLDDALKDGREKPRTPRKGQGSGPREQVEQFVTDYKNRKIKIGLPAGPGRDITLKSNEEP